MGIISEYMSSDHHRCDNLFATAEEAAESGDWQKITDDLKVFLGSMHHHFAMEEDVLFPAIEKHIGMSMGPTQIMRMEHKQMRQLFDALTHAVENRDKDDYLGQTETLLVLMQQHNLKEEQILYRMADDVLENDATQIIGHLKALP